MSCKFPADQPETDPCGLLALADAIKECSSAIDQSELGELLSADSWRSRALYLRHVAKLVRDWAREAAQ